MRHSLLLALSLLCGACKSLSDRSPSELGAAILSELGLTASAFADLPRVYEWTVVPGPDTVQ